MSRPKPKSLTTVKHFAKISRAVVLRRMAPDPDHCFSERVFWALVLWSWCGPEKTEDGAVVKKTPDGYIVRDPSDNPIFARQKDLIELLGLKPGMKGELSRVLSRFTESGQVWTDEAGTMYIDPEPPAFETVKPVASTRNWKIADRLISTRNLPADPVARTAAIQWLDSLSTAWKNDHKEVRTRYRELLRQGSSEHGILIDKKSRRVEEKNNNTTDRSRAQNGSVVVVVLKALEQYGRTNEKGVRKMLEECRQRKPNVTEAELLATIAEVGATITRRTTNPVGFLINEVPSALLNRKPPKEAKVPGQSEEERHRYVVEHPAEFDPEQIEYSRQFLTKKRHLEVSA